MWFSAFSDVFCAGQGQVFSLWKSGTHSWHWMLFNSITAIKSVATDDGYPIGEDFINEGRGFSPTHLKFFLLVFSQIKRSQREDQA